MPVAPRPAMARPTIRLAELGAEAQTIEPTSNMARADKKINLTLKCAYTFPKNIWVAPDVNKYAEPYQPISPSELNSVVILGVATPRIDRSWSQFG